MVKKGTITTSGGLMQKLDLPFSYLNYLTLDTRSLSIFRILLGISILYNIVFIKWNFIYFLLGEMAFIPLNEIQSFSNVPDFSVFDFANTTVFVRFYMFLFLTNTILFTLGVFTKYTSILSVFFQFNIFQALNPFTLGPDMFNFHLSFWAMFLPLGNYFSLDNLIFKKRKLTSASLAISLVLLVQISCIYFFTGIFKNSDSWISGYAVRNMLLDDNGARWIYKLIRDNAFFYKPFTYLTLFFELTLPFFIFFKFKHTLLRLVGIIFLVFFHSIIFLSYDVGNFSIAGLAIAALLIPSEIWNRISKVSIVVESGVYLMNSVRIKVVIILFTIFSIYIIIERNFYNYYSFLQDKSVIERMEKYQVPMPVIASIFTQYWRMFAPGPQNHVGWLEICKAERVDNADGLYSCDIIYNSLNDKRVFQDWESFLLSLARNRLYMGNPENYFVKFLSNWLVWKIALLNKVSDKPTVLTHFYLLENRKLCGNQSTPFIPDITKHGYNALDIATGIIIEIKE